MTPRDDSKSHFCYRLRLMITSYPVTQTLDFGLRQLILWLTIPLLFLPKINLVAVSGQTAGVRIDDACLLIAAFLILCSQYVSQEPLTKPEKYFGCFLFCSTVSAVLNWVLFHAEILNAPANLLYVFRLAEYFTFFYVGRLLMDQKGALITLALLFAANAALVALQAAELVGGFTVEGYASSVSHQPTGLAAGHWEVGFIFNLLFAVFLFEPHRRTAVFVIPWIAINVLLITLTGCRSALLGMVAISAYFLGRWFSLYALLTALIGLAIYLISPDLSDLVLVSRSEHLWDLNNAQVFFSFFYDLNIGSDTYIEFTERLGFLGSSNLDESWFVRIYKWSYVIKYALMHPETLLLGLGPGFFGPAIDGGWLRLFTEYGTIGGWLYCGTLWQASTRSCTLIACLIALAVNALFLDIFLAYKAMSVFFLVLGAYSHVNRNFNRE